MKVHVKVWTTSLEEAETFVLHVSDSAFLEKHPKDEPPAFMVPFIAEMDRSFPGNDFRVVPMGKGRYNVIPKPQASA